jgi:hypothetical protein
MERGGINVFNVKNFTKMKNEKLKREYFITTFPF